MTERARTPEPLPHVRMSRMAQGGGMPAMGGGPGGALATDVNR
ncbi:hypothetical protein [Streptomyces sp. DSM 40750]|nr:hypothetical protein [Streptomyces sp. DSM 40750]UUU26078.1 hypothetical protein JIX55_40895 [Streptomyces sp. DSM 40750]